ncbi:MAG: hypothetical protein JNN17_05690 [Verrucomicrobiaceae bacterium]|nr:hypothetical protein [Verrucomicrobiaceae bacterium]
MDTLIYLVIGLVAVTVVSRLIMSLVTYLAGLAARAALYFAKIGAAAVLVVILKAGLLIQDKVQEARQNPEVQEVMASFGVR